MRNASSMNLAIESRDQSYSSLISTEEDLDVTKLELSLEDHPETQVLLRILSKMSAPVTLYLNNLPYDLEDTSELLNFLGFSAPDNVLAFILMKGGRSSGRGMVIIPTVEKAIQAIRQHGKSFHARPVYMNLDGYFGRGKFYRRQIKPRKPTDPAIVRHENEIRQIKPENFTNLGLGKEKSEIDLY